MEIYEKIKLIRKERNISQEEFANKLGVSRQSVISWEKGKTIPQTDMLIKICETYELKLDYFLNKPVEVKKEEVIEEIVTIPTFFTRKNIYKEYIKDFINYKLWIITLVIIFRIILLSLIIISSFYIENYKWLILLGIFIVLFILLGFVKRIIYAKYLRKKFKDNQEKGLSMSPFFRVYFNVGDIISIKYEDKVIFSCDKTKIDHFFFNKNNNPKKYDLLSEIPGNSDFIYKFNIYLKGNGKPYLIAFDLYNQMKKHKNITLWLRLAYISCLNECAMKLKEEIEKK